MEGRAIGLQYCGQTGIGVTLLHGISGSIKTFVVPIFSVRLGMGGIKPFFDSTT